MFQTYKAILQGNRVEWESEIPEVSQETKKVNVYITILEETSEAKGLRPFGLCASEFVVPDDFDAPLSEEIL